MSDTDYDDYANEYEWYTPKADMAPQARINKLERECDDLTKHLEQALAREDKANVDAERYRKWRAYELADDDYWCNEEEIDSWIDNDMPPIDAAKEGER